MQCKAIMLALYLACYIPQSGFSLEGVENSVTPYSCLCGNERYCWHCSNGRNTTSIPMKHTRLGIVREELSVPSPVDHSVEGLLRVVGIEMVFQL